MSSFLPDKYKSYFDISNSEVDELYELLLSIELYLNEKVSLNKAAELCGLSVPEFVLKLRERKIRRITGLETQKDLQEDQETFLKYAKQEFKD